MTALISIPIHRALVPYVRQVVVETPSSYGRRIAPAPYRILPSIAPVIGFQFRGRLSVLRGSQPELLGRSGITGIQSAVRFFIPDAKTRNVIVKLAPFGGYVLLDQCMADLTNRHTPIAQILSGMESVEDELRELSAHQAAERVQKWLLERLSARKRDVHPDIIAAWRLIANSGGRDRIEALAKELGISRRRLERLFQMQVGVGPKEFASLVRFEGVIRELGQHSWASSALDAGYADQAHFIRDFKRRTGTTPTEFHTSSEPG
jgi:AraC-like DNA-binding protein